MSDINKNGQNEENGVVQETIVIPAAIEEPDPVPTATVATAGEGAKSSPLIEMLQKYGLPDDKVQTATAKLDELGVDTVDELGALSAEELGEIGLKPVKARKLLEEVQNATTPETPSPMAPPQMSVRQVVTTASMVELLPAIPADDVWLSSLKTGGILKVGPDAYTAAIRAALASKIGIYEIPKKLVAAMEDFALENDEPVPDDFYTIQKQLTRRSYAEIFAAIDGVDGNFVTEARKKQLLHRIEEYVWPAVRNTYQQIWNWRELCRASLDPAMMVNLFGGGGMQTGIPIGLFAATPDTATLHDAGDELRDAINKALAGAGCVVASAMAYDYLQIKKALEKPGLPAQIGATNREQMFKKLGLSVNSALIRSEINIVRYLMGFIVADDQPADMEAQYFAALFQLGTQIDWRQLGVDVPLNLTNPTAPAPHSGFEGLTGGRL